MTETPFPFEPIGYARVSTYGQSLSAQLEQLKAAGCTRIYQEKATGARADRRELQKMLKHLSAGKVLVGDAHRPPGAFDLRSVLHRQADRGCRRAVSVSG